MIKRNWNKLLTVIHISSFEKYLVSFTRHGNNGFFWPWGQFLKIIKLGNNSTISCIFWILKLKYPVWQNRLIIHHKHWQWQGFMNHYLTPCTQHYVRIYPLIYNTWDLRHIYRCLIFKGYNLLSLPQFFCSTYTSHYRG